MSRFPKPILDVLTLANGDTITVRRKLTHGETTELFSRMSIRDPVTGDVYADPLKSGDATILAYLVDWTIRDDNGDLVPIRGLSVDELGDVIRALDHESAVEIKKAIEAHEVKQKRAAIEEKKMDSAPLSLVTSP